MNRLDARVRAGSAETIQKLTLVNIRASLRSLLFRPVAEHIGSNARAIDSTGSFFAHQLFEHLLWQHRFETIRTNRWSTNFLRDLANLLALFLHSLLMRLGCHAFNQYQLAVSVSRRICTSF